MCLSIPMLGDSFCKEEDVRGEEEALLLSIPMLGDSFCKLETTLSPRENNVRLSIPMLGDSFCKTIGQHIGSFQLYLTFNPHAWGLFLQDVWCRSYRFTTYRSFNPHAWGLFLQVSNGDNYDYFVVNFQSPCLGTLFARE